MPLFSLFPAHRVIWSILASESLPIRLLISLGLLGMITLFLRVLGKVIQPPEIAEQDKNERAILIVPVILIVIIMVLGGLLPQFYSSPVQNLLISFQNLLR